MQGDVRDKKVGIVPRKFFQVPGWCVHIGDIMVALCACSSKPANEMGDTEESTCRFWLVRSFLWHCRTEHDMCW